MPQLTMRTLRRLCDETGVRHSREQVSLVTGPVPGLAFVRIDDVGPGEVPRFVRGAIARGWGIGCVVAPGARGPALAVVLTEEGFAARSPVNRDCDDVGLGDDFRRAVASWHENARASRAAAPVAASTGGGHAG